MHPATETSLDIIRVVLIGIPFYFGAAVILLAWLFPGMLFGRREHKEDTEPH